MKSIGIVFLLVVLLILFKTAPWLLTSPGDFLTDAATRAAYDIEAAVAKAQKSPSTHYTIDLKMRPHPEGCDQDYTIQFSEQSALVVWCKYTGFGKTTSSHTTTYYLRFVDVPKTYIVDKHFSDVVTLDVEKIDGGKDRIVGVR